MFHYIEEENGDLTWTFQKKHLTSIPAHLWKAEVTLLLGSEEHPNLRIVFCHKNNPPEMKYLNISWEEFQSKFDFQNSGISPLSKIFPEDSKNLVKFEVEEGEKLQKHRIMNP